jgi:hypothetical protein
MRWVRGFLIQISFSEIINDSRKLLFVQAREQIPSSSSSFETENMAPSRLATPPPSTTAPSIKGDSTPRYGDFRDDFFRDGYVS